MNIGDTFNLVTGTFTAPVKGVYEFSFSGNSNKNDRCGISVLKNNGYIHYFYTKDSSPDGMAVPNYGPLASTWLSSLDAYDTVKLKVAYGELHTEGSKRRIFNGKLLASL